jgi:hypothetical protein
MPLHKCKWRAINVVESQPSIVVPSLTIGEPIAMMAAVAHTNDLAKALRKGTQ